MGRGYLAAPALLIAVMVCLFFYYSFNCIDGCGPYHNRASAADLDGDGDLDVVVSNLRHETDTIVWAGGTLWFNQRGGKFTSRCGDFGGPTQPRLMWRATGTSISSDGRTTEY
jgi:hypothetical protein